MYASLLCVSIATLGASAPADAAGTDALLKRLAVKPSAKTIVAHVRAKNRVIAKPDSATVIHISDQTFFGSLDPAWPGMRPIVDLARAGKYDEAWRALDAHMRANLKPVGGLRDVADYRRRYANSKPGGADRRADRVCRHVIKVWHQQVVDFGEDMDWTNVKGFSSLYGFHYWGWAHSLWRAYIATGNEKYAAGFDDLFSSWYAQRPKVSKSRKRDPIWYELGCGCRGMVFGKLYYAMLGSESLRPETRRLVLKTLLGHANQLQAQQACGYTNGNFQLTASGTLYQLGLMLPMFKDAPKWRETATARLLEHAYWDFDPEGGHHERCVGYGAISLHAVRRLLLYADDDPAPSPLVARLRERMLQMQLWFVKYVAPNGVFMGVNDFSTSRRESMMLDYARFACDGRFLWPYRGSKRLPKDIKPRRPEFTSVHLPAGGWTFMRDGWTPESFYMLVNWGKYGGGHTHPALMDVNVFAHGAPMTIETARFSSYDNPLERWFRSPEAHNQLTLKGAAFDRRRCQGEQVEWRTDSRIEYFEGVHRGYEKSAGLHVKRQILFVKGEYWLVVDTLLAAPQSRKKAAKATTAELNWHAPHKWRPTDTGLTAGPAKGPGVQLVVLPATEAQFHTSYENEKEEMYRSRYRAWFSQPTAHGARFITLIAPYKRSPMPCTLEMLEPSKNAQGVRIVRADKTDRVIFATDKSRTISAGGLTTDACLAWLRESPREAVTVDGSRLTFEGQQVRARQATAR